jgi:hypothetical protein
LDGGQMTVSIFCLAKLVEPLGDEGCLAESGGGGDERQPAGKLAAAAQTGVKFC